MIVFREMWRDMHVTDKFSRFMYSNHTVNKSHLAGQVLHQRHNE